MNSIDDAIKKWKKAEEELERFNEMMELIERYPVKTWKPAPPCGPYRVSDPSIPLYSII